MRAILCCTLTDRFLCACASRHRKYIVGVEVLVQVALLLGFVVLLALGVERPGESNGKLALPFTLFREWPLLGQRHGTWPSPVSYTHLTLPTTPYV